MKQRLKQLFFRLLGKVPDAVVVSFATGPQDTVRAMVEEVLRLIPDRRHFLAGYSPLPVMDKVTPIALHSATALGLWLELRRHLRRYRVGMAPVLFSGGSRFRPLRSAALLLAPRRILAYNARLERHHLQPKSWLASLLFVCGVPLDRIFVRPRWLAFLTPDRTIVPDDPIIMEGRPPRPGRLAVGLLAPFLPYPLAHGGAVRIYALLRAMSEDYDVYLFAFRETESPSQLQPLLEFCSGVAMVTKPRYREPRWASLLPPEVREYESAPMRRLIARQRVAWSLAVFQVEYAQLARYRGDILVLHDVTFDLYSQVHARRPSLVSWWDLYRWRRFESSAIRRFRRIAVMSDKDARLIGAPHARVIPNGVELSRFQPRPEPSHEELLFVGSFRHFPNLEAFEFLSKQVWPLLESRFPAVRLTVVAGPEPELWWRLAGRQEPISCHPRVTIHGFVEDVVPLYRQALIVVVPTLVSAGTNLKLLEAMAMERAVVSTPSGCGGLPVEHERHLLIADSAPNFAAAVARLLTDADLRRRLAQNARQLVEQSYGWQAIGRLQCALIREVAPNGIQVRPGTLADLAAVRAIQSISLPASRWFPEHYLRHEFYVATCGGVVAGFIVARQTAPAEREILNIAVAPEFRGRGIGERLLRTLLESGEPGDVFLEVRESNAVARRLYARVGFEPVGLRPGYYDNPVETAVVMRISTPLRQSSFQNSSASEGRT